MLWVSVALLAAPMDADRLFVEQVAPILERRCVTCHNDADRKGGLSLQHAEGWQRGGDSGPVFIAEKPTTSPLLSAITGDKPAMPATGSPLSLREVEAIRNWLAAGAKWPSGMMLIERSAANRDWWSLRPVARPEIPATQPAWSSAHPIDRFIHAKLVEQALSPSPPTDRRTLIRRLSFDLLGLPPTPDEIAAFVNDGDPLAYERLVDRYLASLHYGERWARHWLDVVHYGDTHGYDKDQPRPNAWPYRDYVIRALNADKPYGEFICEQLAGDVLASEPADGIPALGFISAGPWDFISHVEVPETKIDGQIARSLDRDDMVVNTLNTFCSVTVQCARCHAHKFDPISQEDYYRLQAVFAAVDRADRPFDADRQIGLRRAELQQQLSQLVARHAELERIITEQGGEPLAAVNHELAALEAAAKQPLTVPPEYGYHSQIEAKPDAVKWVQVDLGSIQSIQRVVLIPCHDTFNNIGAGFGFPVRYMVEVCDDPQFERDVSVIVDRTATDEPNTGIVPKEFTVDGVRGRYVRVRATRLAPRQNDFILALSELQVFDDAGCNRAAGQPVASLDSIEAPSRWRRANLVDGLFPRSSETVRPERLAELRTQRDALLKERIAPAVRREQAELKAALGKVREQLAALPTPQVVYTGTVHTGSGNFIGTGAQGGKPRLVHLLARGDVRKPLKEVGPGVPPLVEGGPDLFALPADHTERDRRVALAEWVTRTDHPLTWRSIVNRIWQYHFGRGLVDSPNDFGRMGQLPTHPELLDWLAIEFRDGGQSVKALHRLIVTSATYQQSSADRPECSVVDAQNAFCWRANRRKLDAESIRDGMLFVAGRWDDRMGGPAFQDFIVERPEHSPHYEYRLHDPRDPRTHRRSIYRFLVRSQPQPFMATLDCADPSMSVDKRNETINPLQALALLNNGLTVVMAEALAGELRRVSDDPQVQIRFGFTRCLGREPSPEEQKTLQEFAVEHGLENACRLLLNLNEFAFVD